MSGIAVAGHHGDAAIHLDGDVPGRSRGNILHAGEEFLALIDLAVFVDESELQRQELAGDRFVACVHRCTQRFIG